MDSLVRTLSEAEMFVKIVNADNSELEIELQNIAHIYNFCPRILRTRRHGKNVRIYMERIDGDILADIYGDDPSNVPQWVWDEIRTMVRVLYEEEGVEYVDITPYNFIEKDDRIYMIDFGDAKYTNGTPDWFLTEFLDGENSWNPDYK